MLSAKTPEAFRISGYSGTGARGTHALKFRGTHALEFALEFHIRVLGDWCPEEVLGGHTL